MFLLAVLPQFIDAAAPRRMRWVNRGMGSLFVAAGTALALFKRA